MHPLSGQHALPDGSIFRRGEDRLRLVGGLPVRVEQLGRTKLPVAHEALDGPDAERRALGVDVDDVDVAGAVRATALDEALNHISSFYVSRMSMPRMAFMSLRLSL